MAGVFARPSYRPNLHLRPPRPSPIQWDWLGQSRLAAALTIPLIAAALALPAAPTGISSSGLISQVTGASAPPPTIPYREILLIDPGAQVLRSAQDLRLEQRRSADLPALGLRVVALGLPVGVDAGEVLRRLRNDHPGIVMDLNAVIRPAAGPVAEQSRNPDAAANLPAPPAGCGTGLRLGMIDGVVDLTHPALRNQRIIQRRFLPEQKRASSSKHGTAVASLLVAGDGLGGAGVMPGATLLVGNIFERHGWNGARGDLFALLKALDWLADEGADAVNLSFESGENTILASALARAADRGLVLVAAAGNGGPSAAPAYPAAHPDVVAVTAVDPKLRPYRHANRGTHIDFAAPGVALRTAKPGGGVKLQSGTSFAAPFVTVAAALERRAGVPASDVRHALARRAQDLGTPGKDPVFGWGLVRHRGRCPSAG